MSKRFMATTLALALLLVPFAGAEEAKAKSAAPRLTLVEPLKDFGTVPKGQKLDWEFAIKNTGTADLEIIAAKPTCGCTVADFDKVIKPGATGRVVAHVDTAGFAGPISKAVTLETNDPSTPNAQVTISAIVKPYVEAHPAGFVRFNMLQGDIEKQSILLYTEEESPFEIVKVDVPQDWISVDYVKAVGEDAVKIGRPGANQYRVDITVGGPETRVGPIAEKIRIVTNSKHQPEYTLNVSGIIRPTYRVEPTGVNFGEVAPAGETALTRTIVVRSNDLRNPGAFQVTKAESGVPGVKTSFKPTAKRGEYEVTLEIDKSVPAGSLAGSVMIHTNDKIKPVITVPVQGMVKTASN